MAKGDMPNAIAGAGFQPNMMSGAAQMAGMGNMGLSMGDGAMPGQGGSSQSTAYNGGNLPGSGSKPVPFNYQPGQGGSTPFNPQGSVGPNPHMLMQLMQMFGRPGGGQGGMPPPGFRFPQYNPNEAMTMRGPQTRPIQPSAAPMGASNQQQGNGNKQV